MQTLILVGERDEYNKNRKLNGSLIKEKKDQVSTLLPENPYQLFPGPTRPNFHHSIWCKYTLGNGRERLSQVIFIQTILFDQRFTREEMNKARQQNPPFPIRRHWLVEVRKKFSNTRVIEYFY